MSRYIETGDQQRAIARRERVERFNHWIATVAVLTGGNHADVDRDDWWSAFELDYTPAEAIAELLES